MISTDLRIITPCNIVNIVIKFLYLNILGTKYLNKWKNIKDNYNKSVKKKSKSGQAADSGRSYIYARQLSFLQTASATVETQSSLDNDELEDQEQPEETLENIPQSDRPESRLVYNQNSTKKRKRDIESTLIDFMNSPIPSTTAPVVVSEPNADKSFFDSILPYISTFTTDQKLDFQSEVLNIIKRYRNPNPPQNYEYPSNVSYYKPPSQASIYSTRPHNMYQSSIQQRTRQTTLFVQPPHSGLNFNPISPGSSSSTTIGTPSYSEEDSMDIFRDGI